MDPELDFNTVRDFATAPLIGALIGIERLSFGRATSAGASAHYALASGIILAWCIMFARVVIEVLIVNPALVASILAPFGAMEVGAALFAWIYFRRHATSQRHVGHAVAIKNPFSLTAAAKFAAFFAAVMLLVKIVQQNLPGRSIYVVAALAGLTDVDAIALSMAGSARTGDASMAANAIVNVASS